DRLLGKVTHRAPGEAITRPHHQGGHRQRQRGLRGDRAYGQRRAAARDRREDGEVTQPAGQQQGEQDDRKEDQRRELGQQRASHGEAHPGGPRRAGTIEPPAQGQHRQQEHAQERNVGGRQGGVGDQRRQSGGQSHGQQPGDRSPPPPRQ